MTRIMRVSTSHLIFIVVLPYLHTLSRQLSHILQSLHLLPADRHTDKILLIINNIQKSVDNKARLRTQHLNEL